MTNNQLTEQKIDMLIENGYDIAYALENLADNEINSDCFEVFSYSESGRETEWDGKITEFAQHAAKAIRHLTDATTALQVELEERRKADSEPVAFINGAWTLVYYRPPKESGLKIGDKLYRHAQQPVVPFGLHPDTQQLVIDFCTALAEKLYKAQLKYGYDADWKQDGWPSQCQAHFHQHITKGDPRDVAAYCAFMWYHGWKTEATQPAPVVPDERAAFNAWNNDVDCPLAGRDAKSAAWLAWNYRAMLQAGTFREIADTSTGAAITPASPDKKLTDDVLDEIIAGAKTSMEQYLALSLKAERAAGNSPVIPEGYVMVPKEPTEEMLAAAKEWTGLTRTAEAVYIKMLAAAPQSIGSEPATVPGKWIPVSERMPETDGNYWGWWSESKRQGPAWFIKSELQAQFQSSEITHWMPLPAAPQEAK